MIRDEDSGRAVEGYLRFGTLVFSEAADRKMLPVSPERRDETLLWQMLVLFSSAVWRRYPDCNLDKKSAGCAD